MQWVWVVVILITAVFIAYLLGDKKIDKGGKRKK